MSPRGVKCSVNVRPSSVRDEQRAEHGVERVHPPVREDDLVQVGVAEARDDRPGAAGVVGADEPEKRRQRARPVGVAGADQAPGTGDLDLEERADRRAAAAGADRSADLLHLAGVAPDAKEAAVRGQQEVLRPRVDVERVDERRLLREVDEPVGARDVGLLRRLRAAAARSEGDGEQRRDGDRDGGAPPSRARAHAVPACASSHSASVVKPTMIASIAYCDRAAVRASP